MATKKAMTGIPSFRRHRASGQAIVTLNGVDRVILPHVSPTIGAMIELLTLTGMRPGEVWRTNRERVVTKLR